MVLQCAFPGRTEYDMDMCPNTGHHRIAGYDLQVRHDQPWFRKTPRRVAVLDREMKPVDDLTIAGCRRH